MINKIILLLVLGLSIAYGDEICKLSNTPYGLLIRAKESGGNYNIYNFYKKNSNGKEYLSSQTGNLVNMTIAQILEHQKNKTMFAVGAYQIVNYTNAPVLDNAIQALGINLLDLFSKDMQDRIFDEYLTKGKRSAIYNYFYGNGSLETAAYATAKEWASMPVKKGTRINGGRIAKSNCYVSYYASNGIDGSNICYETLINAMEVSKKQLQSNECNPTEDIDKDEEAKTKEESGNNTIGDYTDIIGKNPGSRCGGCRDWGLGQKLGIQSIDKFFELDLQTEEAINKIIQKINKAHADLEIQSKDILIQNQKLLEVEANLEAEILFNQKIINYLKSITNTKEAEK